MNILYTESSKVPITISQIENDNPKYKEFNSAMQKVSESLYGSQDYAVIARK